MSALRIVYDLSKLVKSLSKDPTVDDMNASELQAIVITKSEEIIKRHIDYVLKKSDSIFPELWSLVIQISAIKIVINFFTDSKKKPNDEYSVEYDNLLRNIRGFFEKYCREIYNDALKISNKEEIKNFLDKANNEFE